MTDELVQIGGGGQARTQGGSGGSEEPSRPATKVCSTERNLFFIIFCVLFVSGPCCKHSVFTARMHKIAGFGSIFPKLFRGSMPPDPQQSLLGFAQAHFGPPENKKNPPVWILAYGHGGGGGGHTNVSRANPPFSKWRTDLRSICMQVGGSSAIYKIVHCSSCLSALTPLNNQQ